MVVEIVFIDCINGFTDTSFFIDSGYNDTDLQNHSLPERV
jgi:hypothetical protein